ncbi:DUF4112 domain-containing protein [Sinimarinibacterium thermocellulolyticum]|uniref:DUF4112 domain-containing protein n=1 Tax=Sinimarinibacterium thermocellulolyticum TaxID=3170016 RepID=A0ABV2A9S7_9GAMM
MTDTETLQRARATRERAERLSRLLDTAVGIPGTRIRLGLDALLGLIPGIGDALGVVLGGWFLLEGARVGAPTSTLLRMAGNIAVDALVGVVPLLGDVLDVAFKANRRNAKLLIEHLDHVEGRRPPAMRWRAYALAAAVVAVLLLAIYGLWTLLARLF